ncbi:3'(2'),5'-bisphosphate nucleotidase CysQ [Actinomycetospora termitidis]|uniref:3'(2'),5-bisphosphonucleoside 3'(2')-phosphohydrolase n=1 Tax=Actinomycetospora termitidis TaxID=3053470 RepID=A0ABT7M7H0_9PSEU|nr:3'(2'),5'-bisphosphate nucleotidase CysQ [Actinomycetospora sp. Odt1-22]MDL5156513.1 3'(2'),5'-bisphosphate nucleotidase CysQ [Actinomycetospora sp. Odt1-22]
MSAADTVIPGSPAYADDAALARELADATGRLLLDLRASTPPGRDREYAGDEQAHQFLTRELARLRPDDAVLSEEGSLDPHDRQGAHRLWIVDPLDGSSGFGRGTDEWGVHVALVVDGRLAAGAVAIPGADALVDSGTVEAVPDTPLGDELAVTVSRSRPPHELRAVERAFRVRLVRRSAAGVKMLAVLRGEADVYLHSGGQYEWDNAAPMAVAMAAGLLATRIDGSPVPYGQDDPYSPDLLIARPSVHAAVLSALTGVR